MGTILMDIDTLDVFTIDVSAQVIALIDDQTTLTLTMCHTGESGTIDTSTDNQIIILLIHISLIFLQK
jgi:hypothetical protein